MVTIKPSTSIYDGTYPPFSDGIIPAAPVGDDLQWSDDSDATYCDIWGGVTPLTETGISTTLAQVDFPVITGTFNSALLRTRIEELEPDDGHQRFVNLVDDVDTVIPMSFGTLPDFPAWTTFDVTDYLTIGDDPWLTTGISVRYGTRVFTGSVRPIFRVYEVELVLTGAGVAASRRKHPRDDTRRRFPPPTSVQQSRRRAGGYL